MCPRTEAAGDEADEAFYPQAELAKHSVDNKVLVRVDGREPKKVKHSEEEETEASSEQGTRSTASSWSVSLIELTICQRISDTIPAILHLEVDSLESSASCISGQPEEGAWLKILVVSDTFAGLRLIDRHRLVHRALGKLLASGAVQALPELQTLTCAQWQAHLARGRIASFEAKVRAVVPQVEHLEILDLSDGHALAGFFDGSKRSLDPHGLCLKVTVVSADFEGKRILARQQMVQKALGPEINSGKIHALPNLRALTPVQWLAVLEVGVPSGQPVGCTQLLN